ncbi:MAG: DUF4197 domain-containing protein [Chitinophagaceae bacterium]
MKIFLTTLLLTLGLFSNAQLKGILQKANQALGITESKGSEKEDMIAGLKEALIIGAQKGATTLSKEDGFFKNDLLKILLPPEAEKVEKTLRNLGLGSQVDEAILSMNRGAEDACKEAATIFIDAVKSMNVEDVVTIIKGTDTAGTAYLRKTTTLSLTNKFKPVIENSLNKVNATKHWATIINAYNKVSLKKINPDLTAYVTEKSIGGIFYQIGEEEKKIRKDPLARTSELLKRVFGNIAKK